MKKKELILKMLSSTDEMITEFHEKEYKIFAQLKGAMITDIQRVQGGALKITFEDHVILMFHNAAPLVVNQLVCDYKMRPAIEDLRNAVYVQAQQGNWDHDRYMHGMYNGLELALATMERRDPQFRRWPHTRWEGIKRSIFNWFFPPKIPED